MVANPRALVYGTIAVGALLAAESANRETYAKTVVAVVITLLLYWLAHSYAEFTGRRLESGQPFSFAELVRSAVGELAILLGAAIPLAALLISWAAGAHLTSAVTAAIWCSAAMILVIEVVAGLRASLSGRDLARQAAMGTVLGLLVIALRVVLH